MTSLPLLRFEEAYFERLWGGDRLRAHFGKPVPPDRRIGEAWLIADHEAHVSRVSGGPLDGRSLHELLCEDPEALLGSLPKPDSEGRFPLLLKLLDSNAPLSVQVHPGDAAAVRLGERDGGKTEMWHVIEADPGAEIICGLDPDLNAAQFEEAVRSGELESRLTRFQAAPGASVFVAPGTVHALGAGFLIAEIQQTSDLTYRIYDWMRRDRDGNPRTLHLEKAMAVIDFGQRHPGPVSPRLLERGGAPTELLCACTHFAAERISVRRHFQRETHGESFHLILPLQGELTLCLDNDAVQAPAGRALLVPGSAQGYGVRGRGVFLDYYVPAPGCPPA
ncbi:MAG: class I mannose-6-phosphate isomerase [Candidatus Hydrogenedentes bacterium]|nr:class I mannose-6-phosphate isomerase [Candidatus Hydrogenedentota bacterium]